MSTTSQVRQRPREFRDRLMAVFALVTLLAAYLFGLTRTSSDADLQESFQALVPSAQRFEQVSDSVFAAYNGLQVVAYITIGKADGYGGEMELAVAVDTQGQVINVAILKHLETYEYLHAVEGHGLPQRLVGKSCMDAFRLGEDVDGVSGATYTASAIAQAAGRGCRQVGAAGLGLNAAEEAGVQIKFGAPEIVLILLFTVGFVAHRRQFKYTRQVRWISMIAGMLLLGFWLNRPLSIVYINQLLMGLWPSWQENLYWFLLVGGVILITLVDNKNPYCEWFCPFGAAQECVGFVGGAKVRSPGKFKPFLIWLQRGLAWLAIMLALIFRNPNISSYEVFSALFDRNASTPIFIVLAIVLLASLVIRRPWCTYLCPLHPVIDFIQMIRRWALALWIKYARKTA